jgi:hypothetical protein
VPEKPSMLRFDVEGIACKFRRIVRQYLIQVTAPPSPARKPRRVVQTLRGKRDAAIVSLLLGCGLRRRHDPSDWPAGVSPLDCQVTLVDHSVYGSGSGPKSGGGMRCFVAASYAEAIRKSVGSEKGLPKNIIPTGSFAGTDAARRVPSRAVASRTRSNT